LAMSVEDAHVIAAAVQKAGVCNQMFSNMHTPWAQAAKKALNNGEIGELRAIHCDVLFAKGHVGTAPVGRKRVEKPTVERYTFIEAKREMFDVGVYPVSMINWLTQKRVKTVFGTTANYFFEEHISCDIEDFGALMMTLEDGVVATIISGRAGWMSHPKGGVQRLHLIGTRGTLAFDGSQPRLEVYADEEPFRQTPAHPMDPMGMWSSTQTESGMVPKRQWVSVNQAGEQQGPDMRAFVDCIEAGRESEMNATFAAQSVAVIRAGYESAASGKIITL
jgi:predicted dehydrogenase